MAFVESFEELLTYKKQREMASFVYGLTKAFPKEEMYSLTDQVRRSSRSVGANIAEAWGKRRYPAHFRSKLTDSIAEYNETRHWLNTASDCGLLSADDLTKRLYGRIGSDVKRNDSKGRLILLRLHRWSRERTDCYLSPPSRN